MNFEDMKFLIELKQKDEKEYNNFLKGMKEVTIDFIKLAVEMEEELRKSQK